MSKLEDRIEELANVIGELDNLDAAPLTDVIALATNEMTTSLDAHAAACASLTNAVGSLASGIPDVIEAIQGLTRAIEDLRLR
jgi:phage-related minor tail protein